VISGVDQPLAEGAQVIQAGTALDDEGRLVSAGGRVLAVVGTGSDLAVARHAAYASIAQIRLHGSFYRSDIARAAAESVRR